MKPKIAIVRGKFLNKYEMQFFEPLTDSLDITAFGSLTPFHTQFAFPTVQLPCPLDLPDFPYKMQILNRLFIDAHYLFGLEKKLDGFDIVHTAETYFHYTQQCLQAKRNGRVKKVIATVLENIPFNNEGIWGRKQFKARARKELDHIIALTELTKSVLLEEGANPKKITVISHFIDTKRFVVKEQVNRTKKISILFCGRLEEYKGIFDILSAASALLRDTELADYKLTFTFVGDGSKYEEMREKELELGILNHVMHTKATYDDMPSVYRNADIYVAPSKETKTWKEQYNTTLLEAQASGLPIITTRSGGIPENVGNAAVLIAPGNAHALAFALKKFILDPKLRTEYGENARKRAENVHDIRHGAKKLRDLYHDLLS
jgi:alpha-maltose-1-phosphate synthase